MKLQMLSFRGDNILDRRIKEASNYCDNSHIYAATFGVCRIVLAELSPIDLDGHKMLSIIANVEQQITGKPGYNYDTFFKVSFFNLDRDTSQTLYQFKRFDEEFQLYVCNLLLDILIEIDEAHGGKNHLAEKRKNILARLCNCHFQKEVLLKKFSKISPNKKYEAMVYQCLGQGFGDAIKVRIVNRATNEVLISKWMTEIPCTIYSTEDIYKTCWDGDKFYVVRGKREPRLTNYVEAP